MNLRAVGESEHLVGEIPSACGPVAGVADVEAPDAVQQVGERRRVERRVALALAEQAVVGVERELGALVVDPGLRDEEMQCRQLLLHQLHEATARARPGLVVEHRVGRPPLEAEHLAVSRVIRARTLIWPGSGAEQSRLEMATARRGGRSISSPAQEHVPVDARDEQELLPWNEMRDGPARPRPRLGTVTLSRCTENSPVSRQRLADTGVAASAVCPLPGRPLAHWQRPAPGRRAPGQAW